MHNHTRPEAHQNLIHPDKEHTTLPGSTHPASTPAPDGTTTPTEFLISTVTTQPPANHQPPTKHGGGDRVRTDDPLLAKQVLSQLSYAP